MRLFRAVAKQFINLQPSMDISDKDLEYLITLINLYNDIRLLPGHIAEIGVAEGRNAVIFGKLIKLFGDHDLRQYVGFDTFNGYLDRDIDRDPYLNPRAWKNLDLQRVMRRCQDNNVEKLVEFHMGDVLETAPKILREHKGLRHQPGKARFVLLYIDCNTYGAAINSMRIFLPYMVPGGRIVIDEKMQGGETEALISFAEETNLKLSLREGVAGYAHILIPNTG